MNETVRRRGNKIFELKHRRNMMANYEYRLQNSQGLYWSGVMGWQRDKGIADAYGCHESANKVREALGAPDIGFVVNRAAHSKGQVCMGCGSTNTFIDGPETIGCYRCGNLSDRRR